MAAGFERAGFSRQQAKRTPAARSRRSETSQSARVELVPFPGRRPPLQSPENNCSALDFYLTSFLLRRFVASRGHFVFRAWNLQREPINEDIQLSLESADRRRLSLVRNSPAIWVS